MYHASLLYARWAWYRYQVRYVDGQTAKWSSDESSQYEFLKVGHPARAWKAVVNATVTVDRFQLELGFSLHSRWHSHEVLNLTHALKTRFDVKQGERP